ncbi:MAG: HAD family hydrolase [Tissierellia bacterium]|nr:HAD family hydrolase [Tissierellia bacterium]
MKKLWIFDLDGTIIDTLESIANSCNHILDEYGYNAIEIEEYKYFLGNGAEFLMKSVFDRRGIPMDKFDEIYSAYLAYYKENPTGNAKPFEGIKDFILKLKKMGIKRVVLSNKPHEAAVKVVSELFGEESFDIIIGDRDDLKRKPDPEALDLILNKLKIKVGDAFMVGDTEVDIRTGKNADVDTIAVTWGFRTYEELKAEKPCHIVDKVKDMNKFIEGD